MKLMGVKSNCQVLLVPNYHDLRYNKSIDILLAIFNFLYIQFSTV